MNAIEKLLNKRVIIRADRAGVFYGTLAEIEPLEAEPPEERHISWWEKFKRLFEF